MSKTEEIVRRINDAVTELAEHLTHHPKDALGFGGRGTLVLHGPEQAEDYEREAIERDTFYLKNMVIMERRHVLEGERDEDGNFKELIPGATVTCVLSIEEMQRSPQLVAGRRVLYVPNATEEVIGQLRETWGDDLVVTTIRIHEISEDEMRAAGWVRAKPEPDPFTGSNPADL